MTCRGSLELAKTTSIAIAAAKLASIQDLQGHAARQMGSGPVGGSLGATSLNSDEVNLINLLKDSMPAPGIPAPTSLRGYNNFVSSVTLDPALMGNMGGQHPPQQQFPPSPAYAQQPCSNYALNPPAQQPPQPDPSVYGQPPPTYGQPPQQQPTVCMENHSCLWSTSTTASSRVRTATTCCHYCCVWKTTSSPTLWTASSLRSTIAAGLLPSSTSSTTISTTIASWIWISQHQLQHAKSQQSYCVELWVGTQLCPATLTTTRAGIS
jgi:hypothetical protein